VTLREILESAAADEGADANAAASTDGGLAWTRDGVPFATLDATGGTATFRLDPTLASAAARTPDAVPAAAGPAWVSFAPVAIDGHAEDRARAWFAAAYRRAAG
jgi:hypothetical protein